MTVEGISSKFSISEVDKVVRRDVPFSDLTSTRYNVVSGNVLRADALPVDVCSRNKLISEFF